MQCPGCQTTNQDWEYLDGGFDGPGILLLDNRLDVVRSKNIQADMLPRTGANILNFLWEIRHELSVGSLVPDPALDATGGNALGQLPASDNPDARFSRSPECISWVLLVILVVSMFHDQFCQC